MGGTADRTCCSKRTVTGLLSEKYVLWPRLPGLDEVCRMTRSKSEIPQCYHSSSMIPTLQGQGASTPPQSYVHSLNVSDSFWTTGTFPKTLRLSRSNTRHGSQTLRDWRLIKQTSRSSGVNGTRYLLSVIPTPEPSSPILG